MKCHRFSCIPLIIGLGVLAISVSGCRRNKTYSVRKEIIRLETPQQIVPLTEPSVKPLLYTNITGLGSLPVPEAKTRFISAVLPAILVARQEIETIRTKISVLQESADWNEEDSSFFIETEERFKASGIDDLILRIGTLPNSIVLAQAAVESGWGQSRFFLEGNNLFGIWSFNANEPRIAAGKSRQGKTIYIRSYNDISQSIVHYFEILGSSNAYRSLRKARLTTDDPLVLLPHLRNFSERRTAYTNQLKDVIVRNNLLQYDDYHIDPEYLVAN